MNKAPIIDTITLEECLANDWISPYTIYNLEVPFTPAAQLAYNKIDNNFKFFAMKMGYGDTFSVAKNLLVNGTKEEKGWAGGYFNSMRARKKAITDNASKAQVTVDIINRFPDLYSIVFSESISFADEINSMIPDISVSIHSKMTSKKQKEAMATFKDGRTKKRVIASCKALTAGLDLPKLSLGIIASFNSSKLASTQTVGRIVRRQEGKQAYIINLYTPNTQEVNWLKKKQLGVSNIKWIKSINEII
jgi:superfamily II DNA or RNA helicase